MTDRPIPDEIMMEAMALARKAVLSDTFEDAAQLVASALMARDERAAEIAREYPKMIKTSPDHIRGITGADIAAAILDYSSPSSEAKQ